MGVRRRLLSGSLVQVGGDERSMGLITGAALVLNATYEPLCVVPMKRAVVLVLAEKATVVEAGAALLHSERSTMEAPSGVRLSRYVRVPYRREVPMTRRAVLDRDDHLCVYCGVR